ncbi:MAG: N-6 DNA methylase [Pseudomonadota bacterium]|nr:MAG: hypothetical protein DIU78_17530 [Pseudomonadota bacterium]
MNASLLTVAAPHEPREHRARERLRQGAIEALLLLGRGFLAHPENERARAFAREPERGAVAFTRELHWLVCRLVVLFVAEARGLVNAEHPVGLRAIRARLGARTSDDAWDALRVVFTELVSGEPRLGVPGLGSLFAPERCAVLDASRLENRFLGAALDALFGEPGSAEETLLREFAPEELGTLYEGLLELRPAVIDGEPWFVLRDANDKAHARRSRGSYYTPEALVTELLDAALEPVVAEALARAPDDSERALLALALVDPACGSGHFLLAASRRLAAHVARVRDGGSAGAYRAALRSVIRSCVYGVDLDPLAVELCKVSLWLEAADPNAAVTALDARIRCGNALLGARPEWTHPNGGRPASPPIDERERLAADAWCAAFVCSGEDARALTATGSADALFRRIRDGRRVSERTLRLVRTLAEGHGFFHFHLAFPEVSARGGFDLVLGNPPWIAHAGRASQPLPPALKAFYRRHYESFADYPTTHGMFVTLGARLLREGGYLGLILPSSVSELEGYAKTRVAHDRLCEFPGELVDFGEGRFEGVTQPCMALVSRRAAGGRTDAPPGSPWPVRRTDLDATGRALLARLAALPPLPASLFGERGVQSDRRLLQHFTEASAPTGRFSTPIREGGDIHEFRLSPPRLHVDRAALGARIRSPEDFRAVRLLIRQTARYPIAALSDGVAFRNSVLAGFENDAWPAFALLALLNSALVRWLHYARFRDARQPILPQLKIAHLRAIPAPPALAASDRDRLARFGERLSSGAGPILDADRRELDGLVYAVYGLSPPEIDLVSAWHAQHGPHVSKRARSLAGDEADRAASRAE